jgi:hypothetical protein
VGHTPGTGLLDRLRLHRLGFCCATSLSNNSPTIMLIRIIRSSLVPSNLNRHVHYERDHLTARRTAFGTDLGLLHVWSCRRHWQKVSEIMSAPSD